MNFSDIIKALTIEWPGGGLKCGDWLVALLGVGILTVIATNSDKVEGWVRAATGHDGEVDIEKLKSVVEGYQTAKPTKSDDIDFSAVEAHKPITDPIYTKFAYTPPTYEDMRRLSSGGGGLSNVSHNTGANGSNFQFITNDNS